MYDPTVFAGCARYYLEGRPPYSHELGDVLTEQCGLDGTGRLLDVGCGPGVLAVALSPLFEEVVGLDPDPEMLDEGRVYALREERANVSFVHGLAEELPALELGEFRLAIFGQSFQWTDRDRVAEDVFDLLEPGGSLVVVGHTRYYQSVPDGVLAELGEQAHPPIPHDDIRALIDVYLGTARLAGQGLRPNPPDSSSDVLARTRFGGTLEVSAPGRTDIVRDADGVLANYLSASFCAPHLLGERLDAFCEEIRDLLARSSSTGLFIDYPGDTRLVIARKPATD